MLSSPIDKTRKIPGSESPAELIRADLLFKNTSGSHTCLFSPCPADPDDPDIVKEPVVNAGTGTGACHYDRVCLFNHQSNIVQPP
jgi:hypothetical protein